MTLLGQMQSQQEAEQKSEVGDLKYVFINVYLCDSCRGSRRTRILSLSPCKYSSLVNTIRQMAWI